MHLVFLDPSADSLAKRDQDRSKTAYGEHWNVRQLRDVLHLETAHIGLWLDSTDLSAEETVDRILADPAASLIMPTPAVGAGGTAAPAVRATSLSSAPSRASVPGGDAVADRGADPLACVTRPASRSTFR